MRSKNSIISLIALVTLGICLAYRVGASPADQTVVEKFVYLSKHTSSSCSGAFPKTIAAMPKGTRITGSCCSPMNLDHYREQIEALKKYKDIKDIPPDPYDIDAPLAARLMMHYDISLSPKEQQAYDYAMQHSNEKGPCCCKCWHWKAYGGLAKDLIRNNHFTGEQVTEVWNISDGCGGADDDSHAHG